MFELVQARGGPLLSIDQTRMLVACDVVRSDVLRGAEVGIVIVEVDVATREVTRAVTSIRRWNADEVLGFARHSKVREAVLARVDEAQTCRP